MRGVSSPMRVTQEGPDGLSRYCPVRVICLEIQLCFLTGALLWPVKLRKPLLWVAWIHTKICTLLLSEKTNRYRLNRGGDRAANSALHIIAIGRLQTDDKTKEYVARRVAEGHTKMEVIRCLKRYISREVYTLLRNQNRQINSIPITA